MLGAASSNCLWYKYGVTITYTLQREPNSLKLTQVPALAQQAMAALNAHIKIKGQVTLRITNDEEVKTLNRQFRGMNKATNVLAFPQAGDYLGDVVIAGAYITKEAKLQRKTLAHHLQHMIIHGVLHLCGFDHIAPAAAREMESLEKKILNSIGVSNPYA